eukprot:gene20588-21258_t
MSSLIERSIAAIHALGKFDIEMVLKRQHQLHRSEGGHAEFIEIGFVFDAVGRHRHQFLSFNQITDFRKHTALRTLSIQSRLDSKLISAGSDAGFAEVSVPWDRISGTAAPNHPTRPPPGESPQIGQRASGGSTSSDNGKSRLLGSIQG